MKVERLLQINIAMMSVLGTIVFTMAHPDQSLKLPLLATFVALTAVVFIDGYQWFHLNRIVANILAILIFLYTTYRFAIVPTSGEKLLEIADLLAYLQFVLFYEKKGRRTYAHLIVLSVLQVVVASALHLLLSAGVLLVTYIVVAISAGLLFFLYCERVRVQPDTDKSEKGSNRLLGRPSAVFVGASNPYAGRTPWTALIRVIAAMTFTSLFLASVAFYSMPRQSALAYRGPSGALPTDVGFEPEVELGDEFTELLQSNEQVMRIAFFDHETDEPYTVLSKLYIRGAVLPVYDFDSSNWQNPRSKSQRYTVPLRSSNKLPMKVVRQEIILAPQDDNALFAVFPPLRVPQTWKKVKYDMDSRKVTRDIQHPAEIGGQFRYTLGTTAFRRGVQTSINSYTYESGVKLDERIDWVFKRDYNDDGQVTRDELPDFNPSYDESVYLHRLLSTRDANNDGGVERSELYGLRDKRWHREMRWLTTFDPDRFAQLKATAASVLREKGTDTGDQLEVAYALRDHFLNDERYDYTLNFASIQRDTTLDPIEDFVANHRRGHCEYFASALAMMLRSQSIPSRLVVGYKEGEFNILGNYYQIKEKNAHAWVEAYIAPEHIRDSLALSDYEKRGGIWVRLDPTPAIRYDELDYAENSILYTFNQFVDYCGLLWSDYVIGFNSESQEKTINPLKQQAKEQVAQIFQQDEAEETETLSKRELITRAQSLRWLAWFGSTFVVIAIGVMAVACRNGVTNMVHTTSWLTVRLMRPVLSGFLALGGKTMMRRSARKLRVDFYEEMVAMCSRHGIQRDESQTHREFADSLYQRLNGAPSREQVAQLPRQIVEAFYRVRFGGVTLDGGERNEIDQSLATLREALAKEPNS